jgi:hypothetical protein
VAEVLLGENCVNAGVWPGKGCPWYPCCRLVSTSCTALPAIIQYTCVIPQTSHNIDCALGPLCYIKACSIWIAWQRSSPMKGELRWRGANSISKFHHHNINGGAVDDTWRRR